MRSRASSRCRAANVAGGSGCIWGIVFSVSVLSGAVPGCCVGCGMGDVCAALAPAAVVVAMEAGIGGEVVVLDILANAGAAFGTLGGGTAGE